MLKLKIYSQFAVEIEIIADPCVTEELAIDENDTVGELLENIHLPIHNETKNAERDLKEATLVNEFVNKGCGCKQSQGGV